MNQQNHFHENQKPASLYPGRIEQRGDLTISISDVRVILRGAMFPLLWKFSDTTITAIASSNTEHSERSLIRSEDGGQTWRPWNRTSFPDNAGFNLFPVSAGRSATNYYATTPIHGEPGWYSTERWETADSGESFEGPLTCGRLYLPPDRFDAIKPQWFHGNITILSDNSLLAIMQGIDFSDQNFYPFHVFCCRSNDGGKTWLFLSEVASLATIDDPHGLISPSWQLHGPCEANIQCLPGGNLVCVMRLVNDDRDPPLGEPQEAYRDLSYTVASAEIAEETTTVPPGKYYELGQRSVPLVVTFSPDGGQTWTRARPLSQARGCFPRLAQSDGLLALTYGGLAFPRWGNCFSLSRDGGHTWCEEINFAPFLTTGYTDIVSTGPGHFLCVFDCTPPQPWTQHEAHWVGVVDIHIEQSGP